MSRSSKNSRETEPIPLNVSGLSSIPNDVLPNIFSKLNIEDRANLSLISKDIRKKYQVDPKYKRAYTLLKTYIIKPKDIVELNRWFEITVEVPEGIDSKLFKIFPFEDSMSLVSKSKITTLTLRVKKLVYNGKKHIEVYLYGISHKQNQWNRVDIFHELFDAKEMKNTEAYAIETILSAFQIFGKLQKQVIVTLFYADNNRGDESDEWFSHISYMLQQVLILSDIKMFKETKILTTERDDIRIFSENERALQRYIDKQIEKSHKESKSATVIKQGGKKKTITQTNK